MNLPDLAKAVIEASQSRISKGQPQALNRVSSAGDPCERSLVFARTRWEDRPPTEPGLKLIFDGGNMIEDFAIDQLRQAGLHPEKQNSYFTWRELELTGHIDVFVRPNGKGESYPVEIKSMASWIWDSVSSMEDMLGSSKPWILKYPAQLLLYMLMSKKQYGAFFLVNKQNFRPKCIWVDLYDWMDYSEELCAKLERVNAHIKEGTLPEQINDAEACQYCDWLHICLPEIRNTPLEFSDDPRLVADLDRFMELKPYKSEYEKLDKKLKPRLEGVEKAVIGDYLITGKWHAGKAAQPEGQPYWMKKIVSLAEAEATE